MKATFVRLIITRSYGSVSVFIVWTTVEVKGQNLTFSPDSLNRSSPNLKHVITSRTSTTKMGSIRPGVPPYTRNVSWNVFLRIFASLKGHWLCFFSFWLRLLD